MSYCENSTGSGGFDLDAVAIQAVPEPETATLYRRLTQNEAV